MAQKRTIVNKIDSTLSTCPPYKSRNGPIQWLGTPNKNVNQSSNVNIQSVLCFQNMNASKPTPANSVIFYEKNAALPEEKDRQLIKLYTPGNCQCLPAPTPQINSSAENVLNVSNSISSFNNYVQSNVPSNFSEAPAVISIISPENNQSYVNQKLNSYGTFTIGPTFLSAPNTVVNSSTNIQSNEFGIPEKGNEQVVNPINIPALQPFTYYTKTSNHSVLLSQGGIKDAGVPSTSSNGGFQQNTDIGYKVQPLSDLEAYPILGASLQNLPIKRLFQFPNASVAAVKLIEARAQKECAKPKFRKIAMKIPNQERTVIPPSNKQQILLWASNQASEMTTEPQGLVQEEQSNSTMVLEFFEELGNVQQITEAQDNIGKQFENRKRKLNLPVENMTVPVHCEPSNEQETATNSKLTRTTPPVVNDDEVGDEFINCLCGEFDINDKGDIEFPGQNEETYQNTLGCNDASQTFQEYQVNRELKEKKNKVGVVLKKKERGYESCLL